MSDRPITVLGAGIGGLAVAAALAQRGVPVEVCEQAPALTEVGAGIQISQNGMAVLRALGIAEGEGAVQSAGVELRDFRSGRQVLRLDPPAAGPTWFYHRADLLGALERRARALGVAISLGARADRIVLDGDVAELRLSDGRRISTSRLIGADGVRGITRPLVAGKAEPIFSRQVAWRALVASEKAAAPARAVVSMGPGRHVVSYPLRGGRLTNLVAVEERRDWTLDNWHTRGDPDDLRARFADFGGTVRAALSRVETVHLWALYLHPVAQDWGRGPLVLLGDAAHPTLPFMAQGACLALEDAWVLASCLAGPGDGVARYQALRRARAEQVVAAAARNATRFHLRTPMRQVAHLGLRLAGRWIAPRHDWIYGYDVTA